MSGVGQKRVLETSLSLSETPLRSLKRPCLLHGGPPPLDSRSVTSIPDEPEPFSSALHFYKHSGASSTDSHLFLERVLIPPASVVIVSPNSLLADARSLARDLVQRCVGFDTSHSLWSVVALYSNGPLARDVAMCCADGPTRAGLPTFVFKAVHLPAASILTHLTTLSSVLLRLMTLLLRASGVSVPPATENMLLRLARDAELDAVTAIGGGGGGCIAVDCSTSASLSSSKGPQGPSKDALSYSCFATSVGSVAMSDAAPSDERMGGADDRACVVGHAYGPAQCLWWGALWLRMQTASRCASFFDVFRYVMHV